jgi:molybdopterin/thiamine biosynthesis adenylyltransferase
LNVTTELSQLSDSERARYGSQIDGQLGLEGQLRLRHARAIVIGAGAAGTAAASHLVSCGVGYVAVVDGGRVDRGDLAGQALYYTPDVGEGKADTVTAKLSLLNPDVQVESYPVALDASNAAAIVAGHDLVLDCAHDAAAAAALDATGVSVLRISAEDSTATAAGAALGAEAIRVLSRPTAEAIT